MNNCVLYNSNILSKTSKKYDELVFSSAIAFENYPMFNYILGENSKRSDIKMILYSSLKADKNKWIGLSFDSNNVSLAILYLPFFKGTKTLPFLFHGGYKLLFKNSLKAIPQLARYEKYAM